MAADYAVTGQRHISYIDGSGSAIDGMQVDFALNDGKGVGFVRVPLSAYTVDTVKAAIDAEVSTMKAVEAL